jgi:hypothetical protein
VRSAHHQEDLEVDKGVGKQECNPWLKLEPNMATECMHLLLRPPPPEAACLVPAGIPACSPQCLSRHIHHLIFFTGWRNARNGAGPKRGSSAFSPLPPELPRPGDCPT